MFRETCVLNRKRCRHTVLNGHWKTRLICLQFRRNHRELSQQNTSWGSALKLRAYCFHVMHKLRPTDHAARSLYYRWIKDFFRNNIRVLDSTFFPDEAWSILTAVWTVVGADYEVLITCLLTVKLRCTWRKLATGMRFLGSVIGPIFFEETVNAECYLDNFMKSIVLLEVDSWFQQAGATWNKHGIVHVFSRMNS